MVVSATGILDAVTTVEVRTQVSGIIDETVVDFNNGVHEGQVIAGLAPRSSKAPYATPPPRHSCK